MASPRIRRAGTVLQALIFGALVLSPWLTAALARPFADSAYNVVAASQTALYEGMSQQPHNPRSHLLLWLGVGAVAACAVALLARHPEGDPIRETS